MNIDELQAGRALNTLINEMSETPFHDALLNLGKAIDACRYEIGHKFIPVLTNLLDTWFWIEIKLRYAAANKRGLALALFITGVAILCR